MGRPPSDAEVAEYMAGNRRFHERLVLDELEFDAATFEDAVIVSAEESADFWRRCRKGLIRPTSSTASLRHSNARLSSSKVGRIRTTSTHGAC